MMAGYDRLTPEGERFLRELEELAKLEAFVGYKYGESKEENGADTAEVAAYNELGAPEINIPSRPFMRNAVDNNMDKINAMAERQARRIYNGATAEECLKEMGEYGVRLIREEIRDGDFVENAKETIRRKSRRKSPVRPLIDRATMREVVRYVVRPKGAGD